MAQLNEIITESIARQQKFLEEHIKKAFFKHFNYDIENVKDIENLQRSIHDRLEFYDYRGETFFLIMKEPEDMTVSPTSVTINADYYYQYI